MTARKRHLIDKIRKARKGIGRTQQDDKKEQERKLLGKKGLANKHTTH